mmetsp:Transcript_31125/g.81579  ORF Transcript_31125/g.81579 Transcript_31125/m.81579 type:complete len:269 (+) Transcript_31125:42-848(+)
MRVHVTRSALKRTHSIPRVKTPSPLPPQTPPCHAGSGFCLVTRAGLGCQHVAECGRRRRRRPCAACSAAGNHKAAQHANHECGEESGNHPARGHSGRAIAASTTRRCDGGSGHGGAVERHARRPRRKHERVTVAGRPNVEAVENVHMIVRVDTVDAHRHGSVWEKHGDVVWAGSCQIEGHRELGAVAVPRVPVSCCEVVVEYHRGVGGGVRLVTPPPIDRRTVEQRPAHVLLANLVPEIKPLRDRRDAALDRVAKEGPCRRDVATVAS